MKGCDSMKNFFILFIIFMLIFSVSQALADTSIKVNGKGKVEIEYDFANIEIGVSIEDKELNNSFEQAKKIVNDLLAYLKKVGMDKSRINSNNFNIDSIIQYNELNKPEQKYRVDYKLKLKITKDEFSKLGELIQSCIDLGANQISNLTFRSSKENEAYKEALSLAVLDAQNKAETIAKAANITNLKIDSIKEFNDNLYEGENLFAKSSALTNSAQSLEFIEGKNIITAEVVASFETK